MKFISRQSHALHGSFRVPGDKSISHRSIMFGALAEGTTQVTGFLQGEDSLATMQAFREMGVSIENDGELVTIVGVGMQGLRTPEQAIDLGNSGTAMRLLAGLFAGQKLRCTLEGDRSLSRRPMQRITNPLGDMGAQIKTTEAGTAPLHITGSTLQGIDYTLPIASAQVKSAVLLAGMYAQGHTCVTEPAPSRDHTERMLQGFGYPIQQNDSTICIKGGGTLIATDIDVPADISSAAFFLVAASICEGSDIRLQHVGINPTRTGVIEILRLMGADIRVHNMHEVGGEPVADIQVKSAPLHGIQIPEHLVPLAIDEFPVLFVAAAMAEGVTELTGAEELRVKESDRIAVMAEGLQVLGVDITPTEDGARIVGGKPLGGGVIDSEDDHRIAMSFAVAGLCSQAEVVITGCETVQTSFPGFVDLANQAGFSIEVN